MHYGQFENIEYYGVVYFVHNRKKERKGKQKDLQVN